MDTTSNALSCLKAIANFKLDDSTDARTLLTLAMAMARTTLEQACCGDAACYNRSSGVPCVALHVGEEVPA